jgi:ketosteroid isomerase-like protein
MESPNVTLVKQLYDAFGRGDIPAILERLQPDVVWTYEGPGGIPYAGCMHGPAEVVMFFDGLGRCEQDQKLVPTEFLSDGSKVAVFGRYEATVKANGVLYHTPFAHFWQIRDGKVARYHNYSDTARVLAAHTSGR